MTSPMKPPARPREPRTRTGEIDRTVTILRRAMQRDPHPETERHINRLLEERHRITKEGR